MVSFWLALWGGGLGLGQQLLLGASLIFSEFLYWPLCV
jgi:hypothetical protein